MFLWVYPGVARCRGCIVARGSCRAAGRRGGRVCIGKGRTLAAASWACARAMTSVGV